MQKILLRAALLLTCFALLAYPGSAAVEWVQTFESHPSDEPLSEFTGGGQLITRDKGFVYFVPFTGNNAYTGLTINKPFNDYIAFDCVTTQGSTGSPGTRIKLTITNSSNAVAYDGNIYTLGSYSGEKRNRIEFEETAGGNGINVYCDGALVASTAYTNAAAADGTGKVAISFCMASVGATTTREAYIDNICSFTSAVVGCDNEADYQDAVQYFDVGFPVLGNSYWIARLYSPNDILVSSQNVTSFVDYSFNTSLMNQTGSYTIRLFQHSISANKDYFFAERTFQFTDFVAGSLTVDKAESDIGGRIKISTVVSPYEAGYTVRIVSSGKTLQTYTVDEEMKSFYFTIPDNTNNYVFVYLVNGNGDIEGFKQVRILSKMGTPTIELDKETYTNNETIYAFYKDMPLGTKISATFYYNGQKLDSYTETVNDVVGSITFSIAGRKADTVFIEAYSNEESYTSVTAEILAGSYRISGKVYNAVTGMALRDVIVMSEGFTTITNELGEYSANTFPGNNTITVHADGYQDLHVQTYVLNQNTVQNFYIVPNFVSLNGGSIYGIVTDYYTGNPISGASVRLVNGNTGYSTVSDSRGYYKFDRTDLNGTWTITSTAEDHEGFSQTITVEGNTYLGIRLVSIGGVPKPNNPTPTPTPVDTTNYSAQPYGAYGRHAFDFDGNGKVSGEEWQYAVEHLSVVIGCLMFMGFLTIVSRAGRR